MVTKENVQRLGDLIQKRKTTGLTLFSDEELLFFRDNINLQEHKTDVMLEIQRRQTDKTIKEMSNSTKQIETYTNWTRFMAIATAVMALATVFLLFSNLGFFNINLSILNNLSFNWILIIAGILWIVYGIGLFYGFIKDEKSRTVITALAIAGTFIAIGIMLFFV